MTRFLLVCTCYLTLVSCDCYQRVSGTVIDKESGKPMAGVTVYNKQKDWSPVLTDSVGHFELSSISGGFRCPPMQIILKMEHYQTLEKSLPSGSNNTIELSH